jgi:hypothetical protein
MRALLPLAVAFMLAGAVEAQEVPQHGSGVQATEAVHTPQAFQPKPALEPAPRLEPVPVQSADGVESNRQQSESRAADAMVARQAPGTTNWWWLVAAIVVAGLIVVAIT